MKLSNGFEIEVNENALDDWDLFQAICEVDKGNAQYTPQVVKALLGEDGAARLADHLRENGKVRVSDMMVALAEILENLNQNGKK